MSSRFLKIALLLGLLSAIGPFAIDMYLPTLPAFFLSLGVGQLLYVGLVFIGGFALADFFAYLANSSFVMIDHYGVLGCGTVLTWLTLSAGRSARQLERAL